MTLLRAMAPKYRLNADLIRVLYDSTTEKVVDGRSVSKIEGIKLGDAMYFAFITALSVGYGDIHPETSSGKLVSVSIGLVGMFFVGVTVAIANRSLAETSKRHLPSSD